MILPVQEIPFQLNKSVIEPSNARVFKAECKYRDSSVLWIGMVDHGQEEDEEVIRYYVDYLKKLGIVEFPGITENGSVMYCTDIAGNDLVHITIALEENDNILATTNLKFRPFFAPQAKEKIIKIKLD